LGPGPWVPSGASAQAEAQFNNVKGGVVKTDFAVGHPRPSATLLMYSYTRQRDSNSVRMMWRENRVTLEQYLAP
jgi:hypothetical protein